MLCRKMSELKVFRVTGEINKPNLKTPFTKELLAIISKVEEISTDDIENPILKKIVTGE